MREDKVVVRELDAKHGAREDGNDFPLELDCFLGLHGEGRTGARRRSAGSQNQKTLISSDFRPIAADALRERALR